MTDIWESCPMKEKPTRHYYDLRKPFESATYKLDLEMWNWLEKLKAEFDRLNKEGLEHYAIAVEYYEKLEAIKTHRENFRHSSYIEWLRELDKILETRG